MKYSLLSIVAFLTFSVSIAQCPDLSTPRKSMASSFHSSIVIDYNDIVTYWGDAANQSTGSDQLSPVALTGYTGSPLSVAAGSTGASNHQLYLHTSTNIYGWGESENTIVSGTGNSFVSLTTISLPSGVSISDVNYIEAAGGGLCLVTNTGTAYVRKGNAAGGSGRIYGDGSTTLDAAGSTVWHQVLTAAATPLTGIDRISMSQNAMMASTAGGNVYVWGENTYLGTVAGAAARAFATLVTKPTGVTPADVNINTKIGSNSVQFILGTDGKLYGIGENASGVLGQGTLTDVTSSWVTVKGPGGVGELTNIVQIGSNNPWPLNADGYNVGALTSAGKIYLWGDNNSDMIGGDTLSSLTTPPLLDSARYTVPQIPPNFSYNGSSIGFFEMGGHTTAAFQAGTSKFCYVGHKIRGSMGDGTGATGTRKSFDCINTPETYVCPPAPAVGCPLPTANDIFASSVHASLVMNGTPSVTYWGEASSSAEPGINVPAPKTLYEYNGSPKGVAASGVAVSPSAQATQMWLLTSAGIWGWGYSANTILSNRSGVSPIAELPLPSGVTASQISFIRSSRGGIALVTNSGNVWVRAGAASACSPLIYGDGSGALDAAGSTTWHQVQTAPATPLTGVVELSFAGNAAIAITNTQAYIWGANTFIGNGSAAANRNRAALMTLPPGVIPRTAEIIQSGSIEAAEFILSKSNKVYSLGRNANGVLGLGSATTTLINTNWDSLSLIGIRKLSSNNPFASGVYSMGAITLLGNVYLWGANDNNRLGFTSTADVTSPTIATTVAAGDAASFEIGGEHTIIFSKSLSQFYFAGRSTGGSRANGSADGVTTNFSLAGSVVNCANTAFNLSGNVYRDNNALTDNLVNGTLISSIGSTSLHINLLDEGGYVFATTPVVGGTYSFTSIPFGNYLVQLSPTAGTIFASAPTTAIPIGFRFAGEQIGIVAGVNIDIPTDGRVSVSLSENKTNVNFGISMEPPIANNIAAPPINNSLDRTAIPALKASNPMGTAISTYNVLTLPPAAEGVLYYCATAPATCALGALTAVTTSTPLSPAQSASLYFDPAPTFMGNSSFTYNAIDANGLISNTASYLIPIVNAPPLTINIRTAQLVDTTDIIEIPNLVGADKDGSIASYSISNVPATGAILSYCITGTLPTCTRTNISAGPGATVLSPAQMNTLQVDPSSGYSGDFAFNYLATDNNSNVSNLSTYVIPIVGFASLGGNLPPVVTNIISQNINNSLGATPIPNLMGTDPDGNVAFYTIGSTVPNSLTEGTLSYCTTPPSTGCGTAVIAGQTLTPTQAATLSFDPVSSFIGAASFTYTATDDNGTPLTSASATYQIPVVNVRPVANPDRVAPIANTLTTPTRLSPLTGSDYDGTVVAYTITSMPASTDGTLQYCASGSLPGCTLSTISAGSIPLTLTPTQAATLSFIPNSGFTGDYIFNFTAVDNNGLISLPAQFIIPVIAYDLTPGEPPLAYSFNAPKMSSAASATMLSGALTGTDPDGTIAFYTLTSITPANEGALTYCTGTPPTGCGTTVTVGLVLTPAQALTISFDPNPNFTGVSTFTYTNLDNDGNLSNTATVTIPVVNNPPIAQNINNTPISRFGTASSLNPLTSTDQDGTVVSYTILTIPNSEEGILLVCSTAPSTGCSPVTLGQVLTPTQVTQLAFTPNDTNHSPIVTFLYSTTDNSGNISNVAASNLPMFDVTPLPIDLLKFNVKKNGRSAIIDWKSGVEKAGIQYELQHSTNGQSWSVINTQRAYYNGMNENEYSYAHQNLNVGVHYYRLKVSDLDNKLSFSPTKSINIDNNQAYSILVFPIPVEDKFTISTSDASVMNEVSIFNNKGMLMQQFVQVNSGTQISLNNYASGFYILKIKDKNGEMQVVKLTKK